MYPLSATAMETLRRSHSMRARVTAYTATQGVIPDLPIKDGTVTLDAGSERRATGNLTFAPQSGLWPIDPFDVLSPLGTRLLVERGIVLGDRERTVEWVPLMFGPIQKISRTVTAGGVSEYAVTLSDQSQLIADARLESPIQTGTALSTVAQITALIKAVIPEAEVTDLTGSVAVAPNLDIERERWSDGIEKLATSIGAEVYCDRTGKFVIRRTPSLDASTVVWSVTSGADGVVITADQEASRDEVYSAVVAESSSSAQDVPVLRGRAVDSDPLSPTYYWGAFGKKTRYYASPLITTQAQVDSAAESILDRVKGGHATISFVIVVNPALEPGDCIQADNAKYIVDSCTIPLTDSGTQAIKVRGTVLPSEQGETDPTTTLDPNKPAPADPQLVLVWNEITRTATVQSTSEVVALNVWKRLIEMGYRGRANDQVEALYIPTSALANAKDTAGPA